MAKIIQAHQINTNTFERDFTEDEQGWIYNTFDCCLTYEIFEEIYPKLEKETRQSYDFVRAMQAPSMHMSARGVLIDTNRKAKLIADFEAEEDKYTKRVQRMVGTFWVEDFNPKSPTQVTTLLYKIMGVAPEFKWDSVKKQRVVSTDKECLENILKKGAFYPRPIIAHILKIRDISKKLGTLKSKMDSDNRMRTSYNVTGTETGRWSSNENVFKRGTNFQNVTDELRDIFIADEGKKFAYIDGEQAESRVVAYVSGDENYIKACEQGDLHTYVTRMVWPNLDWSDDDAAHNRKVAEQKFYSHFSYRDMAKRLGHGTNYLGSAYTMAKHIQVERKIVEEFQHIYLNVAFRGIASWHAKTATQLQTKGFLDTPMGRRRYFFGRLDSDDTLKAAIAYVPQSTIGEWLNLGLYRIWEKLDIGTGEVECMMQVHDAILVQFADKNKQHQREVLSKACKLLEFPIRTEHGEFIIPANIEGVGWNWRKYNAKTNPNPDSIMGLKYDEETNRQRTQTTKEAHNLLTRKLS